MYIGVIRLHHKRFSVFGESENCFVSPNRLKSIITDTLGWIAKQKTKHLLLGSQIDASNDTLSCRIHHDLSTLIQEIGYDITYVDVDIDFGMNLVHVRLCLE